MRRTVHLSLELTDGCNLDCTHCFRSLSERASFLDLELVRDILEQARDIAGPVLVSLTGGEPTIHPRLDEILQGIADHGHRFSIVTNGWTFNRSVASLERHSAILDAISFSVDGATPASHDGLRGEGSFKRIVAAVGLCQARGLATQINMVVTRRNRDELDAMAQLATRLGCRALGLAHCMPTPASVDAGLVLDVDERRRLESDIAGLQMTYRLPILLAGDHYDPFPLAGCPQLELQELNVNVAGVLTACCQLSAFRGGEGTSDLVADLREVRLSEALARLAALVGEVKRSKAERLAASQLDAEDSFICTHCYRFHRKVGASGG